MSIQILGHACLVAGVLAAAPPVAAQVLERPPRSVEGQFGRRLLDQSRTTDDLSLSFAALGGYDDNLAAEGTAAPNDPYAPQQSGYVGTLSTGARYWRGTTRRSFDTSGRAYVNTYSGVGLEPMFGAEVTAGGRTSLGGRTVLSANASAAYEPTFLAGAFGPVVSDVESGALPGVGSTGGLTDQRWFQATASAALERTWSTRQNTRVMYDFSDRRPSGTEGLATWSHLTSVAHGWNLSRTTGLRADYRYSDQTSLDQSGAEQPLLNHSAQLGLEVSRRISRTRTLDVSAGGGVTQTRAIGPLTNSTSPSFYGSLGVDLLRTWVVSLDVRREITRLQGLTPQPFVTDAGALRLGGRAGRRVDLAFSAGYSQGIALRRDSGSYENVAAQAQIQYQLLDWCRMFGNYTYYRHLLRDVADIPPGFPSAYDRNAVRVGLTLSRSVHGTSRAE